MNLGLSIVSDTKQDNPCSFEDVLIAERELSDAAYNFNESITTLSNLYSIYTHIAKFGITEENTALFATSFESIGVTFSMEGILTTMKNVISKIREWLKIFWQKIKAFFAKFSSNSEDKIKTIKKKIVEIKKTEQEYRLNNLLSGVTFTLHNIDFRKLEDYKKYSNVEKEKCLIEYSIPGTMWEQETNKVVENFKLATATVRRWFDDIDKEVKATEAEVEKAEKALDDAFDTLNDNPGEKTAENTYNKTYDLTKLKMKQKSLENMRGKYAVIVQFVTETAYKTMLNDADVIERKITELKEKAK